MELWNKDTSAKSSFIESDQTPPNEEVVEFDTDKFKTNDKKNDESSAKTAQEIPLFSPRKFDNHKNVKF